MTKKIEMSKVGIGTVILEQGVYSSGESFYTLTANGITVTMANAGALNSAYIRYKKAGWMVKQPKVAAPKEPKPQKQYPEGFEWDAEQYYRIAKEHRFSFCNQYGKVIVPKKYRDQIYQLMADENNANA